MFETGASIWLSGSLALLAITGCSEGSGYGTTPSGKASDRLDGRPSVEVMHWLTTGGESAALSVMREQFTSEGGAWHDTPMPSVALVNATAMNRILGGRGPDVFQVSVGLRLQELARHRLLEPIPLPTAEWDSVLPPIVARAAKQSGVYMAAPIGIYGENWMFYNKSVLASAGVAPPTSWKEFLQVASLLKAAGKTPIALGGQPWQERILFNSVLLGVGGA